MINPFLPMLACALFAFTTAVEGARPNVVPSLREWTDGTNNFTINSGSRICVDPSYADSLTSKADIFKEELAAITGVAFPVVTSAGPAAGDFYLTMNCTDTGIGREGYLFEVGTYAAIRANTANGVFYGTRTALQILKQDTAKANIPQGTARDYPQYPYRGFMLDVARNYHSVTFIKDYIRLLGWYKITDFHIHFTDQEGWRLQSDIYPGLASAASYTKAEIRELVALATDYGVSITPEVEMPGHAYILAEGTNTAQYDCNGIRFGRQGALDLANPASLTVAQNLIEEFAPLFNSPDFSIGGDEYPVQDASAANNHALLIQSPSLMSAAAAIGHAGYPEELYHKFLNDCNAIVKQQGKRTRIWSWDFALLKDPEGSIPLDTDMVYDIYMNNDVHEKAQKGFKTINSEYSLTYVVPNVGSFTCFQNQYMYEQWKPYIVHSDPSNHTADKPTLDSLAPGDRNLIGAKLNIWHDAANYDEMVTENMTRPSLAVLGEVLWGGPKSADYNAFRAREKAIGKPPLTALFDKPSNFFEVENATLSGNAQVYVDPYASDGQAVGYISSAGSGVRFSNVQESNKMEITYAARNGGNLGLFVNNNYVKDIAFPATAADVWGWYGTVTEYADIPAGAIVEFRADSGGYANLDCVLFVFVPINPSNLAFEKPVNGSEAITNASFINDRSTNTDNYAYLGTGTQWITLDLLQGCSIDSIQLWHYYGDIRRYHDVIIQVSSSADFSSSVTTVFNNDADNSAGQGAGTDTEYTETAAGKAIPFPAVNARYIRLFSSGNTVNGYNHYVEIEAYAAQETTIARPAAGMVSSSGTSVQAIDCHGSVLIAYTLAQNEQLKDIQVYDCTGRCVWKHSTEGRKTAGNLKWGRTSMNRKKVGSGVYIIRLKTGKKSIFTKICLI